MKKYKIQLLIAGVSLLCYAVFVYAQRHYLTYDTAVTQVRWWNYLVENGWRGISTLNAEATGDYTTNWFFIIALFTKLHLYPQFPIEYSIKFMAVACSLLAALAMFFITKHFRPKSPYLPVIVASITPFLPLFSMDLIKANLTDGMYIMPALWSFYFFLKNKYGLAWFLLALGACFKLMAIYLVPVYLFFYIKDFKKYNLKQKLAPLWSLVAVLICSIPNVLSGGKLLDGIITPILGRNDTGLVMPWFWLIPSGNNFTPPNMALDIRLMLYAALLLIFFFVFFFVLKYVKTRNQTIVGITVLPVLSIMVCFYLMPSQHETYFALASLFALISFIAVPKKEFFINFLLLNIFLFIMYLYGLSWWFDEPFWIIPNTQMGLLYLGLMAFNFYLVYQMSVFYKKPRLKITL